MGTAGAGAGIVVCILYDNQYRGGVLVLWACLVPVLAVADTRR